MLSKEIHAFRKYLSSNNLKATRSRILIFEEIISTRVVHPNAYEIHRKLENKGYKISLATIYRTLNLLVKSGLVSEIDLGEDHSHYEPEIIKAAHGHLVCLSCGKVKEFSDEKIHTILSKIGQKNRFKTDKFSIQVFGYCRSCQKK